MTFLENWQDWIVGVGNFILFLALLPSIFSPNKPSAYTSALTGLILTTFIFAFWSLGLPSSTIAVSMTAAGWYVLLAQKILQDRKQR